MEISEQLIVHSPYDNELVGVVKDYSSREITDILKKVAQNTEKLDKTERLSAIKRLGNIVQEQKQVLATLISKESGLCKKDSLYEVGRTEALIQLSHEFLINTDSDEQDIVDISDRFRVNESHNMMDVIQTPVNLVAAITPFNHPINQVSHKVVPNFLANANMVLKPSEKTPLSAVAFFKLLYEAGFPSSQYQIVTSSDPVKALEAMLNCEQLEVLAYTGSLRNGHKVAQAIAQSQNPFLHQVYELGGNSALYVSKKADIKMAATIALGAFKNSGQRCTSIKRLLIHENIADIFLDEFLPLVEKLQYGNPYDENTDVGCVISNKSAMCIERRVNNAVRNGGNVLLGHYKKGAVYSPTVIDNVPKDAELVVEETFGPVAPIIRVDSMEDALQIVNNSKYGLAGAIVTEDEKEAKSYFSRINVGQFSWNGQPGFRFEHSPFGGFRMSGNFQKEGLLMAADNYRKIRTFYTH